MVERFLSHLLGPLVCMTLLPAIASAQTHSQGLYLSLYGQLSWIGSSNFTESGPQGAGSGLSADFNTGFGFGGDIGWRFGNGWAAELEWNYRSHSLDSLKQSGVERARDGDFASNILLLNGLRRFSTGGPWTPYLGAGIGWVEEIDIDFKPSNGGPSRSYSENNKFAFQLIAGVEYAITPQLRLTTDARWLRVGSVRMDNESGNPGGNVGSLDYNPISLQFGIRYAF